MKKVYSEAEEYKTRLEEKQNKLTHAYNQRKELIYSKKNEIKRFELAKLLNLPADLAK